MVKVPGVLPLVDRTESSAIFGPGETSAPIDDEYLVKLLVCHSNNPQENMTTMVGDFLFFIVSVVSF